MDVDPLEVRLRAVEFIVAHTIAKLRSPADLIADRENLQEIEAAGQSWMLLGEFARETARDIVLAAIELLEAAEFQQGASE
ncbi:hypothetical protein [Brevundimonas sp.]|uniref:hypothetical protein n=1 Tax=Brevundimonas sp. TaxID=1871086 RepID=UPI0026030DD2|nr:hypothetical protein [Brevundimonas sp.]